MMGVGMTNSTLAHEPSFRDLSMWPIPRTHLRMKYRRRRFLIPMVSPASILCQIFCWIHLSEPIQQFHLGKLAMLVVHLQLYGDVRLPRQQLKAEDAFLALILQMVS